MNFGFIVGIGISLVPMFVFLSGLVFLDSYKLVKFKSILLTLLIGCGAGAVCFVINMQIIQISWVDLDIFKRYIAPIIEEFFKALYLTYLIYSKKIGFMVDAAIFGFAIGTGFAFLENSYYLQAIHIANPILWIVRGFGTAIMHGGTTAIFAVLSHNIADRKPGSGILVFLPGLFIAISIHSFFNHFFLTPLYMSLLILVTISFVMLIVFQQSEKATRNWLGVGFDTDVDLLNMIITGNISETRIGKYLESLQNRFRSEIVADILCYLRIYIELSVQAKGILLMREAGFNVPPDPEIHEKFKEMKYLEKNIGKTGTLTLVPFLRMSNRDLWQLHMLNYR